MNSLYSSIVLFSGNSMAGRYFALLCSKLVAISFLKKDTSCPKCNASLFLKDLCEECKAPLAFLELKNGGIVQICSRRGCKYHFMDYTNFAQKLSVFYDKYKTQADPSRKE